MKNIIAVIGPTGVGKSNLAIQIGMALDGEIINADSMQVYKGLDIITNKISFTERRKVPHHLMDEIDPLKEFTVQDWTLKATGIISEIHSRNKIPILVGGTHYYLQSILTSQLISSKDEASIRNYENIDESLLINLRQLLEKTRDNPNLHAQEMSKMLKIVDPIMGNRWHPKDGRKLRRSLQIFYNTGQKQSQIINNQKSNFNYRTCIVWPIVEKEILDSRLDSRIDEMIKIGLVDEISSFYSQIKSSIDYTRGIFQAIGFKEFKEYFKDKNQDNLCNGIESMKLHTRQYAKRQITWIKNKLLGKLKGPLLSVIAKDVSDLSEWEENSASVIQKVKDFLNGIDFEELPPNLKIHDIDTNILEWKQYECTVCKDRNTNLPRIFNGIHEWNSHLESRIHCRNLRFSEKATKINR